MKIKLTFSLLLFLLSFIKWGQDSISLDKKLPELSSESISFLQFNTIRDPANVGIQGRNFSLISFTNLPNSSFSEVHNSIRADGYLNKKKDFGMGIYYTLDNWGNRLYQNSLGIAFKKKVKNFHIGFGIEKNTFYKDSNQLTFGDMIDPRIGFIYPTNDINGTGGEKAVYMNFKPSIIYNNDRLKVGVSLNNITEPSNSLLSGGSKIPMETNINASYQLQLKQKWCYTPMLQFFNSAFSQQLAIHNILTFSDLRKTHFLDLSYSVQKSLSAQYGMNFNNHFKFYAQINLPIYYANYFPISAQAGIQYTFIPQK